jgi:hypothetical protein
VSEAFSPEQERRLREILREELAARPLQHSRFSVVRVVAATVERLAGGVVKALRRGSARLHVGAVPMRATT